MHRHELSEQEWEKLQPSVVRGRGRPSKLGDREFINGVIWIAKTGAPWRDLPERFGNWKTVYNRFNQWSKKGIWKRLFKALHLDVDEDGSMVDASVIRAHQHAAGGKGGPVTEVVAKVHFFVISVIPVCTGIYVAA